MGVRPVYASGECEVDLVRRELRVLGSPVPVGGRAFEIIEVLARSAGELVTKDELMNRIWPGAIVMENTLQVHAAAVRKALGPYRSLLKTESRRGYRLLGSWTIRHQDTTKQPIGLQRMQVSGESPGTNLPVAVTPLIGRSAAVSQTLDLLSAYRVVTLTGPGGIGKTALALNVARRGLAEFEDGGWLVELASLSDPDLVPSAVARVLGLKLGSEAISAEVIARSIGGQNLLLVLDNCEHVIDAVASLAEQIVRLCPRITILATSREVFRIEGEYVYRVAPLDVPAVGRDAPEHILGHSAIKLIIARTKSLNSDFLDTDNLPMFAAICRHLDGIPLAIEFAAARVAMLGVQQVANGLRDRFTLLTSGRRTAVPRHRTLRATLDWSYELLTESEQCLLRHLAIFAAGFELSAAAYVMDDLDGATSRVANGIASLVSKSLVFPDRPASPGRWRLFETIRAYALEKLTSCGELALASQRLAQFYRDLLVPRALKFGLRLPIVDLDLFGREIDNVRSALSWSFSPRGDEEIGIALTAAFVPAWLHLALMTECRDRTKFAIDRLTSQPSPDGFAVTWLHYGLAAALAYTGGEAELTKSLAATALEAADHADDARTQMRILYHLWAVHYSTGELRTARSFAEHLSQVAQREGGVDEVLLSDRAVSASLQFTGCLNEARLRIENCLTHFVEQQRLQPIFLGNFNHQVLIQGLLGTVFLLQGFPDQAKVRVLVCLRDAVANSDNFTQMQVLRESVCRVYLMTGDLVNAERSVAALRDLATTYSASQFIQTGNCWQGVLLIKQHDFVAGTVLLRRALDACEDSGWTTSFPEFLGVLAEGLVGLGRFAEAFDTVNQALLRSERGGELWYVAELYRIKGEVLLREAADQAVTADICFRAALDLAQQQGALFWELRAALSLARWRVTQGRQSEARVILAPVYGRFTEGFGTTDLQAARAMLNMLQP